MVINATAHSEGSRMNTGKHGHAQTTSAPITTSKAPSRMKTHEDFTVVPFPEIEKRYGIRMQDYTNRKLYFNNDPGSSNVYKDPQLNTFAVYEGNTQLKALDLTVIGVGLKQPQNRAVLVIGDLHIQGGLDMFGSDLGYPMYLYVTGDLFVHDIAISQLAEIIVLGNTHIKGTLLAIDASVGSLQLAGNLYAKSLFLNRFPLRIHGTLTAERLTYENFWANSLEEADIHAGSLKVGAIRHVKSVEDEDDVLIEAAHSREGIRQIILQGGNIFKNAKKP